MKRGYGRWGGLGVALSMLLGLPAPAAGYAGEAGRGAVLRLPSPGADRFALTYDQARAAFLADRQQAGSAAASRPRVEGGQLRVPSGKGANGGLTADWTHYRSARLGSGNPTLLVLASGTHGVEGPAGSALQARKTALWLERLLGAGIDSLDLHAVNPSGYATGRRVTERNVDLNRNFGAAGAELFRDGNAAYEALAHVLEPAGRVRHPSLDAAKVVAGLLLELARKRDLRGLAQAIAGGQRTSPSGVFYGGTAPEPQVGPLGALFAARTRGYDRVVLADVHTGYGPERTLQLITEDARSTQAAAALVGDEEAKRGLVLAPVAATGMIYRPTGTLASFLRGQLREEQRARSVFIGAELGTWGATLAAKLRTVACIVLENQGAQHGYASESAREVVAGWFRQLFNPRDAAWQASSLDQADALLAAIIDKHGLGEGASAAR